MTVGEEEVRDERELLTRVEDGLMMDAVDSVRYIILHCSATVTILWNNSCVTIVPVGFVLSVIIFMSVAMVRSVSIVDCSRWGHIAVPSTGVLSEYATKADWTRKGIPLIRSLRSSLNIWNSF